MDILNILIVDDEYGMRRGAERALRDITVSLPDINGRGPIRHQDGGHRQGTGREDE